jgi:hypothetical protein
MIDTDVRQFIIDLNTAAGARVYVGNAPQVAVRPLVVMRRTGGSQPRTLSGAPLFERTQLGFDVLTNDYPIAYEISMAIRVALDGFLGLIGTTRIQSSRCTAFPNDQSIVEGDLVIRWVAQEFLFVHSEG